MIIILKIVYSYVYYEQLSFIEFLLHYQMLHVHFTNAYNNLVRPILISLFSKWENGEVTYQETPSQ